MPLTTVTPRAAIRPLSTIGPLARTGAAFFLALAAMSGQTPAPGKAAPAKTVAGKAKVSPKMPWGDPDLQGTWLITADVPLERAPENAGKAFLTDEEVAAANAKKSIDPGRNVRAAEASQDLASAYNAVFFSILRTGKRTSMITDPPDGHVPFLLPRRSDPAATPVSAARQNDNPETIAQNPRCLGAPMPFLPINNTYFTQGKGTVFQIVQSPRAVGIYMEDDHSGGGNRVIPIGNSPHPPANIRFFLGDSRAHWEGSTLVVETTNFAEGFMGSDPATYKMTERFTRVDAGNLKREITFEDPKTWSRPWTVAIDMGKTDDSKHMIFDSACHEGNVGIIGVLNGARRQEQAAKK